MVLQGKRKFRTKSLGNAAERRERRIVLYAIMRESNLSALQAARTLSAITQIIAGSLQKGGMVQVRHWGTFYVRAKPARVVKLNGAVIEAPRKKQVLMRYARRFRESLNLAPWDASGPQSGGGSGA